MNPINQERLSLYYQSCDLYIQVSRNFKEKNGIDVETMGRTYFEAGACGVPVIGSNVGGIPSVIKNRFNGLLIDDPENINEISETIISLLKNDKLKDLLVSNSLDLAKNKFNWQVICKKFEKLMLLKINNGYLGICIATYNNNIGLFKLITYINKLHFKKNIKPNLSIYIVDNYLKSTLSLSTLKKRFDNLNIEYEKEHKKGIPFARNKLIKMAIHNDYLTFIDDDEYPCEIWLDEYLTIIKEKEAEILTGPIIGMLPKETKSWLKNPIFLIITLNMKLL